MYDAEHGERHVELTRRVQALEKRVLDLEATLEGRAGARIAESRIQSGADPGSQPAGASATPPPTPPGPEGRPQPWTGAPWPPLAELRASR